MAKQNVLIEIKQASPQAFSIFETMQRDNNLAVASAENFVGTLSGYGIVVKDDIPPIPMFSSRSDNLKNNSFRMELSSFSTPELSNDLTAESTVISGEMDTDRIQDLMNEHPEVTVWPNSDIGLFADDCQPFQPAVSMDVIQQALDVQAIWNQGFEGEGIIVGIIDEGVNGDSYPVIGGFSAPGSARAPGNAPRTSHGSMCAADVLLAAPKAKLYDYPFLGVQNSGGLFAMLQAVLNQRRIDGTPQILNNSFGYTVVPSTAESPNHEVHDRNHPVNLKIQEVIASGAIAFFAAGNCGLNCPSGRCDFSSIGPGKSIHAANSLEDVITVAAVNSARSRIGYSSQGPGMFDPRKPDLACFSHFFGNFGQGRPGGTAQAFDNGTSAATPVAAGVAALILSAVGIISPARMKEALIATTVAKPAGGFDHNTGHGVIHASNALRFLNPNFA